MAQTITKIAAIFNKKTHWPATYGRTEQKLIKRTQQMERLVG
jgi:hypothetical protein